MGCTYVRWEPPIPTKLADLEGCWNDLFSVYQFIERIEHEVTISKSDNLILDALATAAFVRYARSFTTGVRARPDAKQKYLLDAHELALHERLLAIRSKHIAHPVNCFETHAIYIGVSPDDDTDNARASIVSTGTSFGVGLPPEELSAFKLLCENWLQHVRDLMDQEQRKLLPLAQQLTATQLWALPRGPVELDPNPKKSRSSN